MNKTTIIIECLEAGQPRPYADSRYRATVKVERDLGYKVIKKRLTKDEAKVLIQMFGHKFVEDGEWYQPRLEYIRPIEDGWEVLIIEEYTG